MKAFVAYLMRGPRHCRQGPYFSPIYRIRAYNLILEEESKLLNTRFQVYKFPVKWWYEKNIIVHGLGYICSSSVPLYFAVVPGSDGKWVFDPNVISCGLAEHSLCRPFAVLVSSAPDEQSLVLYTRVVTWRFLLCKFCDLSGFDFKSGLFAAESYNGILID